jgi:hypothetical protein
MLETRAPNYGKGVLRSELRLTIFPARPEHGMCDVRWLVRVQRYKYFVYLVLVPSFSFFDNTFNGCEYCTEQAYMVVLFNHLRNTVRVLVCPGYSQRSGRVVRWGPWHTTLTQRKKSHLNE